MPSKNSVTLSSLCRRLRWEDLDLSYIDRIIEMARAEDLDGVGLRAPPIRSGDVTTAAIIAAGGASARVVAREKLHVCGLGLIERVLNAYGDGFKVTLRAHDGEAVAKGCMLAEIEGPAGALLQAERVLLNFIQRLSGIATNTARYVEAIGGSRTRILDTRKTTPGWRMIEKYAVAGGGGWNHRLGLFDRVMIKDNHLAAAGANAGERLAAAVRAARKSAGELPVEVEVDHLDQIPPVIDAEADIILLDNFPRDSLVAAVAMIGDRAFTEASGGIGIADIPRLSDIGLDFISTGALVHQSAWKDIAIDWI